MHHPLNVLRAILGWLALALVGTFALMVMLVTPGVTRRRRIGRRTARVILAAAGVRLSVSTGCDTTDRAISLNSATLETALPSRCVVVANHTSYLDGVILSAVLPPRFVFVVKKEMRRVPMAGLLLRRMGCEFVDRFNRHRGAMDARRVLRRASQGQALVFFPEGTFSKVPGVLRFHSGAFVAAARGGSPIVPIVIRGARQVLPYNRFMASPGRIDVQILAPHAAKAANAHAAAQLRDEVRRQIIACLGEPDLSTASHVAPILPADFVKRA